MIYNFWAPYETFLHFETARQFDQRLDNIVIKLNNFFQRLVTKEIEKEEVKMYLAGSCIKADTFRDLDIFFPNKDDRETMHHALNKEYFEYENNSYTYRYKNDLYQLIYRDRFCDVSLENLVNGFDFDSTKIAFECIYNTKLKVFKVLKCDMRAEFAHYIDTRINNLSRISVNPFASLQRALHFLKRGDDVPYSVFLDICSAIADIKIKENEN
ncbi:MAG: hypothetical protein EOM50_15910, partial [Erysipelotrichia bacterium]|nr:hypothetical protein [Erysipelotrichia bacterium]